MPSVRQIRRRIRSVENTAKITKAMSMIAASKMRRAQESALSGRPYSERIQSLLSHLAAQPQDEERLPPLLRRRDVNSVQVVVINPGPRAYRRPQLQHQQGRRPVSSWASRRRSE